VDNADAASVAGFGYSFFNKKLLDSYGPRGLDEFTATYHDFLSQPLVNQPGSRWEYGINLDHAGLLVERASGMSLNDYFQQHIFGPMGLKNINMFPTDSMLPHLAYMNTRSSDGKLAPNLPGHLARSQLMAKTAEERKMIFNAGGHGLFAKPAEYAQVIAMLLNDGTHPGTGAEILKKSTIQDMFTNQLEEFPDYGRQVRSLPFSTPRPSRRGRVSSRIPH
jgi:CubicO group peptidase (beta-lactamase class C family)